MIFVTVGEQLPFDRLIRAVDDWAARSGQEVFAQIGATQLHPVHMTFKRFLEPTEFEERLQSADLIVAHAGMGTIITALEMGKPILVMPRQSILGEHRNDHQLDTALRFQELNIIMVAMEEFELAGRMDNWEVWKNGLKRKGNAESVFQLIDTIRRFVEAV